METVLQNVCLASIPSEQLPLLAALRCHAGIEVTRGDGRLWVRWDAAAPQVLRVLLPIAGVRFYVRKKEAWHAAGSELPAFEVPEALAGRPLSAELLPAPVEAVLPPPVEVQPVLLRLVPDQQARAATACLCSPAELQHWADTVSAWRLAELDAACCAGQVLLVGEQLPLFPTGKRFWGEKVLVPMGLRPDPLLPEQSLAEVARLEGQEIMLWQEHRAEVIARSALQALNRSQIRLLKQHHERGE